MIIDHAKLKHDIRLFTNEYFDNLQEPDLISFRDSIFVEVVRIMQDQSNTNYRFMELLEMVNFEQIIDAADLDRKILNVWSCPMGCDIDVVLICGGPWGDNPNGKNRYFQAKLNGAYTYFDEHGIPGVPEDCPSHADGGCCNEPTCPDCGEYCVLVSLRKNFFQFSEFMG